MAAIIADASQTTSIARVSEGDNRQVRALRDGALVTVDWQQALVAEGRVHGVNMGTASTPVTFNDAYAAAEQDLYIYVPAGTVIIPLYIGINFEVVFAFRTSGQLVDGQVLKNPIGYLRFRVVGEYVGCPAKIHMFRAIVSDVLWSIGNLKHVGTVVERIRYADCW